jgi:hypothetical protein
MVAFKTTQIDAIPVAVRAREAPRTPEWRDLLPTLAGLEGSYYALYETFGLIWYNIRNSDPRP